MAYKKNQYFEKVYRYFEGEMSKTEKVAFYEELTNNAELKKEYKLQKQLNEFLDNDLELVN